MDDPSIAEKLVEALARPDGSPKLRPVHSIGIGATGYFVASQAARDYCVAEHFQGEKIAVTVRFSNGSGSATQHDGWSDVRGMATRFHLAEGAATDLIAMTLPEFFTPTPETFLDFAVTAKPAPYLRESPWRKILDMLRLTLPMRNPYPGETISPDAGAIQFRQSEPIRSTCCLRGSIDRRAGELCAGVVPCGAYVHRHSAGQRAPLGSLHLATRRRRSEHEPNSDPGRQVPARGVARSPRRRAGALLTYDVDR